MKILHLNSNYLHTPLYSEMVTRLEKYGVDNTVIMPRKKNDNKHLSENILHHNGEVISQQILNVSDRFMYFNKQKKIKKWIESSSVEILDFDIVHAHTLFSDGYLAYKMNVPYVITVRNTDVNYYFKYYRHLHKLGEKILHNAETVIFLSESYKRKTIRIMSNDDKRNKLNKKSIIIPNGINDYWISSQTNFPKNLKEPINVLFVGRIMKNKNIEFIIKNLRVISKVIDVKFHIVGTIVDKRYFEKIRNNYFVVYHGKLQKEELKKLMNDMHIFTMISYKETFGLVYLEALTQSLPLLYTANEGFDDYYQEGQVGYAVNPTDDEEFHLNFNKILKNYHNLQQNIAEIDKNDFSWNHNVEKHLNIYKNIIK